jgi:hypothetical protein
MSIERRRSTSLSRHNQACSALPLDVARHSQYAVLSNTMSLIRSTSVEQTLRIFEYWRGILQGLALVNGNMILPQLRSWQFVPKSTDDVLVGVLQHLADQFITWQSPLSLGNLADLDPSSALISQQ